MKRRGNVISPIDSISTVVEMLQQTDSTVEDGETVWVRSVQAIFVYRVNSGLTPDGVNVVASLYGNGVWQRLTTQPSGALSQAAWFVDPVNGNDGNTGFTAGTALKTDAERQRRWGWPGRTQVNQTVTVTYLNDVPFSDPVNYDVLLGPTGGLNVLGTPVVVRTSTFTNVTALNRGTQQPLHVTDGAFVWTPLLGDILVIPSGARAGASAVVAKNVGGGVARLSNMQAPITSAFQPFTSVTPQIGDPYQVRTLTQIPVGLIRVECLEPVFSASIVAFFNDVHLIGGFGLFGTIASSTFCPIYVQRSICDGIASSASDLLVVSSLLIGSCTFFNAGETQLIAGATFDGVGAGNGALLIMDGDFLNQGARSSVNRGATLTVGTACSFDCPVDGILLLPNCKASQETQSFGANLFWGNNNATFGIRLRSGAGYVYATKPTVTGTSGDTDIGGTTKAYGAIPFNDSGAAASAAYMVLNA
jgi:hypothetical protein